MTVGIGIFSLPYYVSHQGALLGAICLVLAALLNYYSFRIIFDIASKTKRNTFSDTVEVVLGKGLHSFSKYTLGLDYLSIMILYGIASYNFL